VREHRRYSPALAALATAAATFVLTTSGRSIAQTPNDGSDSPIKAPMGALGLADRSIGSVSLPQAEFLIPDPWARENRSLYRFSNAVDRRAIAPGIHAYIRVVPANIRDGLSNAIGNLREPGTTVNDLLQGHFGRAVTATERFAINSTFGLAGLMDIAGKSGIEKHESDFGQTLGRFGVRSGPYIFVPFIGPSSVRDGVGRIVDIFADPVAIAAGGLTTVFGGVRAGVDVVDARAGVDGQLQEVNREFTDPYATIRSVYSQQRATQISIARGQGGSGVNDLPDFGPEPPEAPRQSESTPKRPDTDTVDPSQSRQNQTCLKSEC
jgi:phospholipid-binding lipoprotein MlaA